MLKEYVRLLVEAQRGIMYPPSRINAKTQSEISSSQSNDKTHMSAEETVLDLSDKFGPNFYINFVRGYKGQVPDLGINPYARYATPHGVYGYILTRKNLTDLFLKQHLNNVDFAMNRPYFHIFQFSTPDTSVLSKSGRSNKYATNPDQYYKDVQEMVRVSLMSLPGVSSYINTKINMLPTRVRKSYREVSRKNYISLLYKAGRRSSRIAGAIEAAYKKLCIDSDQVPFNEFVASIANFLSNRVSSLYRSQNDKTLFLKNIYKIADILSYITPNPKKGSGRKNDASRRALILHSIGINSFVDAGSGTIHDMQPEQAFSIDFGPHSSIKNLGTYNNIFNQLSKKELEDLYINLATYLH